MRPKVGRSIEEALALAGLGFALVNAAFLADFAVTSALSALVQWIAPFNPDHYPRWLPPLEQGIFALLLAGLSWFVFRSRLRPFLKATYLVVPMAAVITLAAIALHRWPAAALLAGALVLAGTVWYLHVTRQPWLYYYAAGLVGAAMVATAIFQVEI